MTATEKLKDRIELSLAEDTFVRLTLSKPRAASSDLLKKSHTCLSRFGILEKILQRIIR